MKRLTEVEPESKVVVRKIEGGSEVKAYLSDLGVIEEVELTLLAVEPVHAHVGPLSLKVAGREVILCQGWADKVLMDKEGTLLPLLILEKGDKGTVKAIEGGKDFKDWVSELGIKEGCQIEFLTHVAHESLVLKIADNEIRIGPGRASRVWVEDEGKVTQLNYLQEGKIARVTKVTGGTRHREEMEEIGLREGIEISLIGREPSLVSPLRRGNYVSAKLGDQMITIGRGMAEKVWVE